MDAIMLTIIFKGLGMLMAFGGGIAIARYGFLLYRDGAGAGRDQVGLELGPIKVKAHSVGSVVMATAFVWALAGVALSPNLEKKGEEIRIYSFKTPEMDLKTQAFVAKVSPQSPSMKNDPEALKKLLSQAISDTEKNRAGAFAELNGKPASIVPSSIDVTRSPSGEYHLLTTIKSQTNSATVIYEPKIKSGQIIFTPTDVGHVEEERKSPNNHKQQ